MSIESLLAQTFGDFELIVSDNASTDATRDVVASLASVDPRIRYIRQSHNVGANRNYSIVAEVARGSYFKWTSSSDLCAPTFLSQCLLSLERNDDAVLAAPRTRLFVGEAAHATDYEYDLELLDPSPAERLIELISALRLNNAMNGLIRMAALRRTPLIESYLLADEVLLAHLALRGKFVLVDDYLYFRRMDIATSTALQDADARRAHHYPQRSARILFQSWKRHFGWLRAGLAAPLSVSQRARVLGYLARLVFWGRGALLTDVQDALRYVTRLDVRK